MNLPAEAAEQLFADVETLYGSTWEVLSGPGDTIRACRLPLAGMGNIEVASDTPRGLLRAIASKEASLAANPPRVIRMGTGPTTHTTSKERP